MGHKDSAIDFLLLVSAGQVSEAFEWYVAEDFRHHNPSFEGTREALKAAMAKNAEESPDKRIEIKHAIAEDSLVSIHSHVRMSPGEAGAAATHLFRFENGKIAELWDVGQPVPKKSPNVFGMF